MQDPKTSKADPPATKQATVKQVLTPAGEATDPTVHQLLAELETARSNGSTDDASDIVGYLADLGYTAG